MSALEALPWQITFAINNIRDYLGEAKEAHKLEEAIAALTKIDSQLDALLDAASAATADMEISETSAPRQ
jgi:hypothetical protein